MLQLDVAPGIHRVEDAYVNWYIVEDDSRLTIVDTGHPRSWNSLQQALRRIGRTEQDIEAVVLTHGHFDHMGFARRARRQLGIPVLAPLSEQAVRHPWRYPHERSRIRYAVQYPAFRRVFASMGAAGALWVRGLDDVRRYDPSGRLDVPGHPEVVFTPGHSDGHCSLHLPERDTLICGDALVTFDPYTGARGPQIVSRAATAASDQALRSLDALAATGAGTVLPGHGAVWRDGIQPAVDLARAAGPS